MIHFGTMKLKVDEAMNNKHVIVLESFLDRKSERLLMGGGGLQSIASVNVKDILPLD